MAFKTKTFRVRAEFPVERGEVLTIKDGRGRAVERMKCVGVFGKSGDRGATHEVDVIVPEEPA